MFDNPPQNRVEGEEKNTDKSEAFEKKKKLLSTIMLAC